MDIFAALKSTPNQLCLMDFQLNEEQLAVRDAARDFAQNVLKPGVIERDENQTFPAEEVKQLGELGFLGMMVDPKWGGSGMDEDSRCTAWCQRRPAPSAGALPFDGRRGLWVDSHAARSRGSPQAEERS